MTQAGQNEELVFNVQRFSVHDGPGIRTTVFIKGCPLRCQWCNNPESWASHPIIMTRDIKCIKCGRCVTVCPANAIKIDNERGRVVDFTRCSQCLECTQACPSGALVTCGEYMTVEQVISVAEKDRIVYQNSGGGVTISGGEPCLQVEFVESILRVLKEKGIHTALDTTGCVPWDKLEKLLGHVDLVLYDVKHLDSEQHKFGTGNGNELILANLERTTSQPVKVWLRIPLIPDYNDSEEHCRKLSELAKKAGVEKVSLLPYHEWGKSKYEQLGLSYTWKDNTVNPQHLQVLEGIFKSAGLKVSVGN